MKRLVLILLTVVCCAVFAAGPALADRNYSGASPLYANKKTVKVYKEQSTKAKVIKKLKGTTKVLPEMESDDGSWIGILVEDTKSGGQMLGWVKASELVDYFPQSLCPHKWGDWTVDWEATCGYDGKKTRYCTVCGEEISRKQKKRKADSVQLG